jgi:hypothetical protein
VRLSNLIAARRADSHHRTGSVEQFDAPFTRLDHGYEHTAEVRFDIMWRLHTGQWWRLYPAVKLEKALRLMEMDMCLQPNV